ncbi:unnamed protein product [Rhizoctonia solani]|uniref:F-box domain-containing protein n=1 Tax=Rhizoctonia solani TaxID=456999 RepID=A0A8H3C498_9AGAM|nr:unnamed protein product [Rhizoctonia solani]
MPLTRGMAAAQAAGKRKTTQSKANNSHGFQAQESAEKALENEHPPRKRARDTKTSTQAPRRPRKARLSQLLDMPPEVFHEVASHLLPADLLSLARSNKFFRKMFMSRTSEHLWKRALANNPDIPDCPPELSIPQYVSLLFSKTCSSCGTKVLRRMDPYLYVRLCTSCRDAQIIEVSLLNDLIPILPVSDVIKEPRLGYGYTSRTELLKVAATATKVLLDKNTVWREERMDEMDERREHGMELEEYLDMIEEVREMELDQLKTQRRDQIEARLLDEGWTKQSTKPSPDNTTEWNRLASQPKPLTDRIWNNLYPKLIPLLKSNQTYNDELDKKNRRRDRIKKLQALLASIMSALPPLVHLVRKTSSIGPESSSPHTSSTPFTNTANSDFKVEQPFPSINELLTWPMIKDIVDDDTSLEQVETRFSKIRDEFDRGVLEWRDKIERDLVAIWTDGREDETKLESTSKGKGKGKGKGKAVARTTKTTRKSRATTGPTNASDHSVDLVLPEFVATYTKPDGTSTTNISDLPPNLQLLLRADTIFGSIDGPFLDRTYPAIVPRAVPFYVILGGPEELKYGDRWNASHIKRDDEMSAVAKQLLVRAGRPGATSVEMKALGANFRCGRCIRMLADTWEDLVAHYNTEQRRHRHAQEKIRAEPERGFIFHNTHGLEAENSQPFAHLMTPQAAANYMAQLSMEHSPLMTCLKCQEMGINARYTHTFAAGFESPINRHLHDVHGVLAAQPGLHFQGWYDEPYFFDSDFEDLDDSEEEWGITGFD